MTAQDAMRLVAEELVLDGIPSRNLATFVTTWMEPEAQRIIAENLHRNFIDHAEYPQSAEIEQRCIRMLADLFHAPGETTGASTQGSSEATMLGALSLKWKWRQRREAAGKPPDRPNLVFGGDVHVVWEKVKIMRALVKETFSRGQVDTFAEDIALACRTLEKKGGAHESERKRVKTGTGY